MQSAYNVSSITTQDLDNPINVFDDLLAHHAPHAHYFLNWIEPLEGEAWRVRLTHDIELLDGTIVQDCFPVDGGWLDLKGSSVSREIYKTSNVGRVRISKRQPLMTKPWEYRGEAGALDKPDYV